MEKKHVIEALKKIRESKRNFNQKIDLIVNLQGLNLKKPEDNINTFLTLPFSIGKKVKICSFVGDELVTKAKACCDEIIHRNDFDKYKEKKIIKKLAKKCDFFIAQANLMADIASAFGKVLGPTGKMPNPKAGCVVSPTGELKPVVEKLNKTVKLQTKNELCLKTIVGNEEMKDDDIAENILFLYNQLLHILPQEKNNIRSISIKLTMGKPVKIENA